jgi:hypothetical protein
MYLQQSTYCATANTHDIRNILSSHTYCSLILYCVMAFTHDKPVLRYVKSSTLSKGGDHPPQVGTEMADKLNSKYSEM